MKIFFILALMLWTIFSPKEKSPQEKYLVPTQKYQLKVPEPSGITYNSDANVFYMVGDNGTLFQTDNTGKILKKSAVQGMDFEGVFYHDSVIYVVEEANRNVRKFDLSLNEIATYTLNYQGGRNKGFESITRNPANGNFILATEKDPVMIYEFDEKINQINKRKFDEVSDISALTFFKNDLFVLSDEDNVVLQLNSQTLQIKNKFSLKIINPEGLCFDTKGNMYVISDGMAKLFVYSNPLNL